MNEKLIERLKEIIKDMPEEMLQQILDYAEYLVYIKGKEDNK